MFQFYTHYLNVKKYVHYKITVPLMGCGQRDDAQQTELVRTSDSVRVQTGIVMVSNITLTEKNFRYHIMYLLTVVVVDAQRNSVPQVLVQQNTDTAIFTNLLITIISGCLTGRDSESHDKSLVPVPMQCNIHVRSIGF